MTERWPIENNWEYNPPEVEVVIEVPRGSFLKRGSTGQLDFVSPLPCPFNYGSVPTHIGGEGDLLDAVVLGPKLLVGQRVRTMAWGSVGLYERFMYDDKLICQQHPLSDQDRRRVLAFFHFYARCKGILNWVRHQPGRSYCSGWDEADAAMARARPIPDDWHGPEVSF